MQGNWNRAHLAPSVARAALGALTTAVATAICLAASLHGRPGAAALYLGAVCIAFYFGGIGAAAAAILFAYLWASWFLIEPVHSLSPNTNSVVFLVTLLAGAAVVVALLRRESASKHRLAHSYEEEQRLRRDLDRRVVEQETSEARNRFLAEAGESLTESLDPGRTLTRLAELLVPRGADWCRVEPLGVSHRAPVVRGRLGPHARKAVHALDFPKAGGERRPDEELSCALALPLTAGDRMLGTVTIARERPFSAGEVEEAGLLARRAAGALDNANLHQAAEAARSEAEAAAGRLRRLQTIVDATFTSGTTDEFLGELVDRLAEALAADAAAILVVDRPAESLVVRHAIGLPGAVGARLAFGSGFAGRIAASRSHDVITDVSMSDLVPGGLLSAGIASCAGAPLIADGALVGVIQVGSRTSRDFDEEDVMLLRLVAARAAAAIERADMHEHEHTVAEKLQRTLLPSRLPAIDGTEIAARYLPGAAGVEVGGDWYDVFELADGSIGVSIGDVMGRGVTAATMMGHLRYVLRAYSLEGLGPGETLSRLSRLAGRNDIFATAVYAVISPSRTSMRIANAGHPPPLLRTAGGEVLRVNSGRSMILGLEDDLEAAEAEIEIEPDSTLLLYTDGLVERRDESIDDGIERLAGFLSEVRLPVHQLVDRLVGELDVGSDEDDRAVLVVHLPRVFPERMAISFQPAPSALADAREQLRTWLRGHGAGTEEIFDIVFAVNEACANAIEHPLDAENNEVGLEAEISSNRVIITVNDSGRWKGEPSPGDRGRGFNYMRTFMQEVEVVRSSDGTSVRLERPLARQSHDG